MRCAQFYEMWFESVLKDHGTILVVKLFTQKNQNVESFINAKLAPNFYVIQQSQDIFYWAKSWTDSRRLDYLSYNHKTFIQMWPEVWKINQKAIYFEENILDWFLFATNTKIGQKNSWLMYFFWKNPILQ